MKPSDKLKKMIETQIREDINSAWENENLASPDYAELLEILVNVSKLEG
jgi:hypothetical protein